MVTSSMQHVSEPFLFKKWDIENHICINKYWDVCVNAENWICAYGLSGWICSCVISHIGICQSSLGSAQRKYSAFGVCILWRSELWKLSSLPFVSLAWTCTHLKAPTENWDTLTSTWDLKCWTSSSEMTKAQAIAHFHYCDADNGAA